MVDFLNPTGCEHTFDFSQASLIKPTHCKKSRRLLESQVISQFKHIKLQPGFYQILPDSTNIILRKNNIPIENG